MPDLSDGIPITGLDAGSPGSGLSMGMSATPNIGSADGSPASAAASAADARAPQTVGQFRWDLEQDRWWWSPGMFFIHGYQAHSKNRSPVVTTDLVLQHKTSDARPRAAAVMAKVRLDDELFAHYHQIETESGKRRTVLVVGQPLIGPYGLRQSTGFMADVTDDERAASTAAVQATRHNRAPIEQARGAVMVIYGLAPDAAMALLIWFSRNHNLKLSDVCRRIIATITTTGAITSRATFDRLFNHLATTTDVTP